jgi:hypothetical protein
MDEWVSYDSLGEIISEKTFVVLINNSPEENEDNIVITSENVKVWFSCYTEPFKDSIEIAYSAHDLNSGETYLIQDFKPYEENDTVYFNNLKKGNTMLYFDFKFWGKMEGKVVFSPVQKKQEVIKK